MAKIRQTIPSAAARAGARPGSNVSVSTTTTPTPAQQRVSRAVEQGAIGVWEAKDGVPIYATSEEQARQVAASRGIKGSLAYKGYVKLSEMERARLQEQAAQLDERSRKDKTLQDAKRAVARDSRYPTSAKVRALSKAELRTLYDTDRKTASMEARRRGLTFEFVDVDEQRIVRLVPYRSVESESIGSLAPTGYAKAGPRTDVVYDAFTGAEIPRTAAEKPAPKSDVVYDEFTGMEIPRTTTAQAQFAGAKGRAGAGAADPTKVQAQPEVAKAGVVSGLMMLPYRNADGTYNLQRMVESGMFSARSMREAGFTDAQITTAINSAMKANAVKSTREITEAMKGPDVIKGEKLSDVMGAINEQVATDQTAAWREANAGFEEGASSETAVQREGRRTVVAGPGEERRWYHWPTGRTISDSEYRTITNDGRNDKAEQYSRTASQVRRGAIETVASFLPVLRPALPESDKGDVATMDWFISGANLALLAVPFVPKGLAGPVQAAAGGVFAVNTAKEWDNLSNTGRVVSVAASALILTAGLHSIVQPSFKPVKVPLEGGGEAVVWRGLSARGRPVVGVTKLPPNINNVPEGWRPITKAETTILGTEKMLRKMGVSEEQIKVLITEYQETKAFRPLRSPYEPKSAKAGEFAPQSLTPDEFVSVLKQVVKNKKIVEETYGSTTIKMQLAPKLRNWRKLGDVEFQLKPGVTEKQAAQLASDILDDLNKSRPGMFRIDPDDVKRILTKGGDHHAVELKLAEVSKPGVETTYNLTRTGEMSWGMVVHQKPITVNFPGVGKLQIMRLSESGVRKFDSISRHAGGGTFGPPAHRTKDIVDYYAILYTFKDEGVANAWAKLYGLDPKKLLAAAMKDPPQLQAWSFKPGAAGRGSPSVSIALPPDMAAQVKAASPALYKSITKPVSSAALASSVAARTSPALAASGSAGVVPSPRAMRAVSTAASSAAQTIPSGSPAPSQGTTTSPGGKYTSGSDKYTATGGQGGKGGGGTGGGTSGGSSSGGGGGESDGGGGGGFDEPPPTEKLSKAAAYGKRERRLEPTGRVQWKQGAYWIMVEPPAVEGEVQKNVQYSRRPFWGVRKVKGNPEQTFAKQGKPPREFLYEMGVTRASIHAYDKPHLRFRQTRKSRKGRLLR